MWNNALSQGGSDFRGRFSEKSGLIKMAGKKNEVIYTENRLEMPETLSGWIPGNPPGQGTR